MFLELRIEAGAFVVSLLQRWVPLIAGSLLAFIGHRLGHVEAGHPDPGRQMAGLLVTELGIALLIAAIVFVIFEQWSARHHCKTAIGLLYGVRPEGPLFDAIEDHVLRQKFYRGKVVVTYAFEARDDEHLLVRQTTSYTVHNVCSRYRDLPVPIRGRVELKPLHAGPTKWDDQLGLVELLVGDDAVDVTKVSRADEDPESHVLIWTPLEERRLGLGCSLKVQTTHLVVKHDHDSEVWSTSVPCDGIELHVTCDPSIPLKFAFSAIHPGCSKLDPVTTDERYVVHLDRPCLKSHGLHFWWGPRGPGEPQAEGH